MQAGGWAQEGLVGPGEGARPAPPRPAPPGSRDVGLAAVVFPGQVAGSGAAGHPHHRELLGVTRDGARVGAHARVLPQHGVCGPQSSGSGCLPCGVGSRAQRGGGGVQGAGRLPSVGLAQSLYCCGLHTGALPGGPDGRACVTAQGSSQARPAAPCPSPLLTRHVHHSAAALPSHIAGFAGQATPH